MLQYISPGHRTGELDNYAKETWYGLLNAPATEPGQHHLSGWLPYGAGDRTARPGASAPSPTNPGYVTRNVILSHQRGGSHARVMSYDSCVMKLMVGYSVSFFSIFSFGQFESKRLGESSDHPILMRMVTHYEYQVCWRHNAAP